MTPLCLARAPLSSPPVTSASGTRAPAPAAPPHKPVGDVRNGVEESYAGGEANQGLTNDGDWSRRSSDTQRARARDKLPHTHRWGLRWIVARPSVRYQPPSAHATGTRAAAIKLLHPPDCEEVIPVHEETDYFSQASNNNNNNDNDDNSFFIEE